MKTPSELVLHVTLTCTAAGKTAYVVEVQQAGVFGLFGLDQHAIGVLLGTNVRTFCSLMYVHW